MSTLRRYLYGEIIRAVGFVVLAFLSLFMFFDLTKARCCPAIRGSC
jgi:lipopolysaccharide export system permease protein